MSRNRQKMARIIALVLAGLMVFSALFSALYMAFAEEAPEEAVAQEYILSAVVDLQGQALCCEQTIVCRNSSGRPLSQLFFALYANALRRYALLPVEDGDLDAVYPNGFAPGGIEMKSVRVDGEAAQWAVCGEDESVLCLTWPLAAGETCEVTMEYVLLLPENRWFIGAGYQDWRLMNAFPTLYPLRNGEWLQNGLAAAGRSACFDAAKWQMTLLLPEGWEAIGTGAERSEEADSGSVRWYLEAEQARDLTLVLSRRFSHVSRETGGALVTAYACEPSLAETAAEYGGQVLEIFTKWFGESPFSQIDIVLSEYALESAAGPGVLLLDRELCAKTSELGYQIALGMAREWFQECAAEDPCAGVWQTEGLSALCAMLAYGEIHGRDAMLRELRSRMEESINMTVPGGVTPESAVSYFLSREEYVDVGRNRGAAALYILMDTMGQEAFLQGLGEYARTCRFRQGGKEPLLASLEKASGRDWTGFLEDVLRTLGDLSSRQSEWFE